jgi:RHS repeat-associated protein
MLWLFSKLYVFLGFVQRCVCRVFLALLLVLFFVLSGAACRGNETVAPPGTDPELSDSDASPIAGAVQGSFAVSSTGEVTYVMPLVVPPGAAGMQPSLAVAYNSASGDGILGMGFSLSGLSSVTRCPRTMAQDGEIRGVRYDQHDALCLDGVRLVQVGSSDGVVEYRTFPDTFVKVLASPSKVAENPAETLKVFTRSGLILEYGGTRDAVTTGRKGVIRSWLVQRSSDRSENTLSYEYLNLTADDGHTTESVPLRINYTGNRSVLPSRMVEFTYEPRAASDIRTLFAGGAALTLSRQLKTISMLGPERALVREYRFAYKTGVGTGRTVLRNIKECVAEDTCKPRTTFDWYGGSPGFERIPTPIEVPQSQLVAPMMLDVTGDGLDDLVVPTVPWNAASHSEAPTTDWTITPNRGLSPNSGEWFFQSPVVAYSEDHNDSANDPILQQLPDLKVQPDYGTPIDYNDDGLMDILVHNVHGTALGFPNTWGVLLATPQHKLELHDTGIPRPKHLIDGTFRLNNKDASAHLADVNGDGIADLLQCERDESFGGADAFLWTLRLWTPAGPGFETTPHAVPALNYFHCAWEMRPVDIDADGKVDLILPDLAPNQAIALDNRIALSYDEASDTWATEKIGTLGSLQAPLLFADVNGDGLPDVVRIDVLAGQPVTILNTGDSHGHRFGDAVRSVKDYLPGDITGLWGLATVLDYNGDGRQDVLVPMIEGDGLPSWILLQSTGATGEGTFTVVEQVLPFDAELGEQGATLSNRLGPRITDVDGDGAPDVLLPIGKTFTIFRSVGSQQDLLLSVHDGLNAHDPGEPGDVPTLLLNYGTLVDKAITDGPSASPAAEEGYDYLSRGWFAPSCAYPLHCVVGPRRVVSEYERNNGADRPRRSRVQYRGGRYDRRGRGFLGFQAKITTDLDTGAGSIDVYGDTAEVDVGTVRTYPEAGQLREAIGWTPNPRPQDPDRVELSFSTYKRELRATNGGATYFLMPTEVAQARKQGQLGQPLHQWLQLSAKASSVNVGGSTVSTTDYDDYGNVLAAVTTAAEVDLTTTIADVKFDNHPDSWLIGQLAHRTECSTAANLKQCRTVARTYDGTTGLLKDETVDAEGDATMHLTLTYGRDAFGNITSTTAEDKLGNHRASWTTYEPSGVFPDKHGNAVGHVVVPGFDAGLGVMTSLVDENQLTTTWEYDRFGRRTREVRPDSTETHYTLVRTKDGGPKKNEWNVKATTTTTGGEDSEVQYDSLARPIRWWTHGTQTGHDPPPRIMQEIVFDELGEHIARRSTPTSEAALPEDQHYDEYSYDPTGRVLTHTTPWSATTLYAYDGKVSSVTDPLAHVTKIENDALGRLVKVTDAATGITSYTYGPFGALWTVTDPGKSVTSTLRDAYGRVRTSLDPDKGTTVLGYNGFSELTSTLDAQGRTSKLFYDPLGRRTRREDKAGAANSPIEVTTWTWDTALLGVSGKLALGALAEVDSPDGAASLYTYDAVGRLDTTERSIGGELFGVTTSYDKLGRVATIAYPDSAGMTPFTVKHEYDSHGHLTKVWDPANGSRGDVFYWQLTATDSADRITAESFGNGFRTTRAYFEEENRLKSIHTLKGDQLVQSLGYLYDAKLNLRHREDALQAHKNLEYFQYDPLDRLTCSTLSPSSVCPKEDSYTYSPSGNLLTKPGISGTYSYDVNHPHAVLKAGADSFTYDSVGNQITRSGASVSYTAFDMPKAFTPAPGQGGVPVTLDYDGDQRRVRKTAGDDVTVYVGELYERTTNAATGAVEHRYFVHGSERAVAVVTRSSDSTSQETTRYLHIDNLGSVETVTDESGSKPAEKRSYDAFGARRNPRWGEDPVAFSSVTTRGFTGHEDDAELGLVNMKGRLFDPKVGRFLTADPIVSHPGFGQSWNPYSYVLNNPLAFTDPSGFLEDALPPYSPGCTSCVGGKSSDGASTTNWVYIPIGPPPPPPPQPPPNDDAWQAGVPTVPVDLSPTGGVATSTPQAPLDGGGGSGGAGQNLGLSAGGGGADSGTRTQAQLTPADYEGFRQNANEQSRQYAVMAVLTPIRYPFAVGVIAFGLLNPDPAYAPTFQTAPEDRPSVLERAGETGLAVAIGAAGIKLGQIGKALHGNSLLSQEEQHVYEILQTDAAGDTVVYKYGVSKEALNATGLSPRAEKQVSFLNRRAGGTATYESSVVRVIPAGPGSRSTALSVEKDLVYKYEEFAGRKPDGNKRP